MSLIQVGRDFWLPDRSLKFGAAVTDIVDCGTGASLDSDNFADGLFAAWMYHSSAAANGRLYQKGTGAAAHNFVLTGTQFQMALGRATQSCSTIVNFTASPIYRLNAWLFIAWQWSTTVTANNRVFVGDFTRAPIEVTAYATQRTGSGSITTNSGATAGVGGGISLPFLGNIGAVRMFSRAFGVPEITALWRNCGAELKDSASRLALFPGDNNLGTQFDLSSNANNGTVTGATQERGPALSYMTTLRDRGADRSFVALPLGMLEWLRRRKLKVAREK